MRFTRISKRKVRTNHDGPDGDKGEQSQVSHLLEREENREHVVGHTLCPPIQGVERITGIRCGNNPFVMRLVKPLIDERVVQCAVDPVNTKVRKRDEQRVLDPIVKGERGFAREVVKFGPSLRLGHEKRSGQCRHEGHGVQGLFNFQGDLIAQEFGMLHRTVIVDKIIRNRSAEKVQKQAKSPINSNWVSLDNNPEAKFNV